jgi:SH3-binding, glutamic acid-rich protein
MILQVLEVKRIPFVKKDIASDNDDRKEFRRLMLSLGESNALPPQICNGDRYIGVRVRSSVRVASVHALIDASCCIEFSRVAAISNSNSNRYITKRNFVRTTANAPAPSVHLGVHRYEDNVTC